MQFSRFFFSLLLVILIWVESSACGSTWANKRVGYRTIHFLLYCERKKNTKLGENGQEEKKKEGSKNVSTLIHLYILLTARAVYYIVFIYERYLYTLYTFENQPSESKQKRERDDRQCNLIASLYLLPDFEVEKKNWHTSSLFSIHYCILTCPVQCSPLFGVQEIALGGIDCKWRKILFLLVTLIAKGGYSI